MVILRIDISLIRIEQYGDASCSLQLLVPAISVRSIVKPATFLCSLRLLEVVPCLPVLYSRFDIKQTEGISYSTIRYCGDRYYTEVIID